MAEQILYDNLYNQLTPEERNEYGGYKIARGLGGEEDANTMAEGTNFQEIFDAQQAAKATKPSAWNPLNLIFSPAASSEMPQKYGLQTNTMGGMTLNEDGTISYNTQTPPNLGFRSMVDMAADTENFDNQFNTESGIDVANIRDLISKSNMQKMMNAPQTQDIDIDSLRDPFAPFQNSSIPQNFRTRMNNPFFERPTLSNASSPANYFNQGLGGVKGIKEKMGQGWDFAQALPGMAMSALSGIPGLGLLTSMLKESPEQKNFRDNIYSSPEYQNLLGQIPGAKNLNAVYGMGSGRGLLGSLQKRFERINKTLENKKSDVLERRRDKIKELMELERQKESEFLESQRRGRRPGSGGSGQGTPDSGGTTGGYSYDGGGRQGFGYGLKYGGRVGYANGGLASLFTRRG